MQYCPQHDLVIRSNNDEMVKALKANLKKTFDMTSFGQLHCFLGNQI